MNSPDECQRRRGSRDPAAGHLGTPYLAHSRNLAVIVGDFRFEVGCFIPTLVDAMKLDTTQKRILSAAINLPVFGFYHGVLIAFPDYYKARQDQFSDLLLNRKPKEKLTKQHRYLEKIKPLIDGNYLQIVANSAPSSILGPERVGVNSVFKSTDKAHRMRKSDQNRRVNYNTFDVTCTLHDMKTAAVLLAFNYGMEFSLRQPLDWRDSQTLRSPLPDGVIVSKAGRELIVEFERNCDRRHLEKHIQSYSNETRVILIHGDLGPEITNLTLELLKQHERHNWYFSFFKPLLENGGRGPYYDLDGTEFIFGNDGEFIERELRS